MQDQQNREYNDKYNFIVNSFEKGFIFKKWININMLIIKVIIHNAIWWEINWYKITNINSIISNKIFVDDEYPEINLSGLVPNSYKVVFSINVRIFKKITNIILKIIKK